MDRGCRTMMYVSNWDVVPPHLQTGTAARAYLEDNLPRGSQWALAYHDKDVYTPEDEAANPAHKSGCPKAPHIHLSIYLPNTKTVSAMAKTLGVAEQNIQMFKGQNAKQNLFSYLVHKTEGSKQDGKHIYDYAEIMTNFDYRAYVEGISSAIEAAQLDRDTIAQQVFDGSIRYIDFIMRPEYTGFYLQNKSYVQTLIDTKYKRDMNDRQRGKITVMYIEGPAGSGKTEYAKKYALKNYRDYCMSSSHNDSTQDYLGQDVMIFDDARPGDFTASEWLKLLDPYNNESSINSRYYNKYLAVKCIILTSVTPFEDFFVYSSGKGSGDWQEPVGQFMRRFDWVLKCSSYQSADILYVRADIHTVDILDKPVNRRVGMADVSYVHQVSPAPVKTVQEVIGRIHPVDLAGLDRF